MTAADCRKLIAKALADRGITGWSKLTSRMVPNPFGGDDKRFVKVWDWTPNPVADELRRIAKEHGFILEFQGNFIS